jgi:hypothetical protein
MKLDQTQPGLRVFPRKLQFAQPLLGLNHVNFIEPRVAEYGNSRLCLMNHFTRHRARPCGSREGGGGNSSVTA